MRSHLSHILGACCLATIAVVATAEEFVLENGGRVTGEWLNPEKPPAADYELSSAGVTLRLPASRVREVIRPNAYLSEYEKVAPTFRDNPAEQWKLAEWCRVRKLDVERNAALERILDLDPNHTQARKALGYLYINGEWTTTAAVREREGYVFYRGRWRTPQEVEILEAKSKRELAEKEWSVKLARWRADIDVPNKSKFAYQAITSIKDPLAITPLTNLWRREPQRPMKLIYCGVLLNMEATDAIATTSLSDPDDEVFYECLDRLIKAKPEKLSEPYILALKDEHAAKVNRAAKALASIKDYTAISPLIDSLVTQHTVFVAGKSPNAYAATFRGDGGSNFSQGQDDQLVRVRSHNEEVLSTLTKLTGANFGFDQKAWRFWHAQEKQSRASVQVPRRE